MQTNHTTELTQAIIFCRVLRIRKSRREVAYLEEKKSDRQIIFATHNANFVINGDAEKIFILKNESGQTEVIETTIEDTKNREELLKLEGGKEAFEKKRRKA